MTHLILPPSIKWTSTVFKSYICNPLRSFVSNFTALTCVTVKASSHEVSCEKQYTIRLEGTIIKFLFLLMHILYHILPAIEIVVHCIYGKSLPCGMLT